MKSIINFIIDHPAFVSALAALISLLFSLFVYFRTRYLFKRKERPMLLINKIDYEQTTIYIRINNSGEHPAIDFNIIMALAPLNMPNKFKVIRCLENPNVIGPGHTITFSLVLKRLDITESKIVFLYFKYKDRFTNNIFEEETWLKLDKVSRKLFEATADQIKEFLPYAQARIKEFRNIKVIKIPHV